MSAPSPTETFTAGVFFGFMASANGRTVRDVTEDELRRAMRDWLEEREAEA